MKLSKRQEQEVGHVMTYPAMASTSFETALDVFLKAQDAMGHSKVSQRSYQYAIGLFLRYMAEAHKYTTVQQITEQDVLGWLSHLRNTLNRRAQLYSSRSIETYYRDVLAFFNWLVGHHYLTVNPMAQIRIPNLNTYITYWRGAPAEPDEHVFLNAMGNPLGQQSGQQIFMRLKRVAGITDKRVSAHTCRHWFAVNCIKRGMPSTVLQTLLGHEQLEMINTYVRLAEQDTRELFTRYSPVDALKMHQSSRGKREKMREWRNARKKKGSPD